MTYAQHLEQEAASETKHDFINGQVYAMVGGTIEHGAFTAALIGELRAALAGKPCRVFTSDVRIRVDSTSASSYPDLSVVCGKLETSMADAQSIANPLVIVEVLSVEVLSVEVLSVEVLSVEVLSVEVLSDTTADGDQGHALPSPVVAARIRVGQPTRTVDRSSKTQ